MTRKTFAKKLLKYYRRSRKLHPPRLARTHAYFCMNCMMAQTQFNKYQKKYWNNPFHS